MGFCSLSTAFYHIESEWDIIKYRDWQKIHIFLMKWIRFYHSLSLLCILLWFLGWKGESEWKLASWVLSLPQTWRGHPKPAALCAMCISSLKTISSRNLILACKTPWWNPGATTNCHALLKCGSGPALYWASKTWMTQAPLEITEVLVKEFGALGPFIYSNW